MKESYFVTKYLNPILKKELPFFVNITVDNSTYKGVADIIGMTKKGKFIAIEVKNEKRLAEKEQVEFIKKVNNNLGFGFIVFLDVAGKTKIGEKAKENRIKKGYLPFTEFKKIIGEL